MIICALLLSRRVLDLGTSPRLRYATLGLLFVNVSVGGTFTHFAAPPVLMVASEVRLGNRVHGGGTSLKAPWGSERECGLWAPLSPRAGEHAQTWRYRTSGATAPPSITAVHLGFLALTVYAAHTPAVFVDLLVLSSRSRRDGAVPGSPRSTRAAPRRLLSRRPGRARRAATVVDRALARQPSWPSVSSCCLDGLLEPRSTLHMRPD